MPLVEGARPRAPMRLQIWRLNWSEFSSVWVRFYYIDSFDIT
jgi:hypothetical protein